MGGSDGGRFVQHHLGAIYPPDFQPCAEKITPAKKARDKKINETPFKAGLNGQYFLVGCGLSGTGFGANLTPAGQPLRVTKQKLIKVLRSSSAYIRFLSKLQF
jgi:hypothetical protein